MATWRELISKAMEKTGDTLEDLKLYTSSKSGSLNIEFDDDLGVIEGVPFTAWTERYVYFPAANDGWEWVHFVPRNPCVIATEHVSNGLPE